jgi:hypothetical protein
VKEGEYERLQEFAEPKEEKAYERQSTGVHTHNMVGQTADKKEKLCSSGVIIVPAHRYKAAFVTWN